MSSLTAFFDRVLYPNRGTRWDSTEFRQCLLSYMGPSDIVLDYGAGRGFVRELDVRNCASNVCGVDIDPIVLENPQVHEAKKMEGHRIPYPDRTFDLVFSACVWEHLEDPGLALDEVFRVLKPGGLYIAKTPSRFHYVCLIASTTPHWFHRLVNRLRGRPEPDTFPTFYRINSGRAIRKWSAQAGFRVRQITHTEGRPEYLRFFAPAYLCGWCYERIVNSTWLLSPLRVTMTIILEKPVTCDTV